MRLKGLPARTVKSLVKWDIQNVMKTVFSKIFQEIKTNISLQVLCVTLQGNNTRQISKETMISDSFDND